MLLGTVARFVTNNRRVVFWVTLVVFVACGALTVTRLGFHSSRHAIVNADDPEQVRLTALGERFGSVNDLVVVLSGAAPARLRAVAGELAPRLRAIPDVHEVFYRVDPAALGEHAIWYFGADRLRRLHRALVFAEKVAGDAERAPVVRGIAGALKAIEEGVAAVLDGELDVPEGEADPAELERGVAALAAVAGELRRWVETPGVTRFSVERPPEREAASVGLDDEGYLTAARGRFVLLRVSADADLIDEKHAGPIVRALRVALATVPADVTWGLTGVPAMVVEEQEAMQRDLPITGGISLVGCVLIFLLAYRSVKGTIVVLLPLGLGLVLALGLTTLTVGHLNLLTNAMAVILVGMGIDFGVHLLARIRHEHALGEEPEAATHRALERTGPPIVAGALTSAAAFATLMLTDFAALEELGLIASLGLLSMLLATFVALPLHLGRPGVTFEASKIDRRMDADLCYPRRAAVPVLVVAAALTVGLASRIEPVEFDLDLAGMLPEDTMSRQTLETLKASGAAAFEYAVMQPADLAEAASLTAKVEALPEGLVDRVESVLDVLPKDIDDADSALDAVRAVAVRLPRPRFEAGEIDAAKLLARLQTVTDAVAEDLPFELKRVGRADVADALDPLATAAKQLLTAARAVPPEALEARVRRFEVRAREMLQRIQPALTRAHTRLTPADLPTELTSPWYRERDGEVRLALRIYPAGDPTKAEFSRRFRDALRGIDPETTGYAVTYSYFGLLMQDGFRVSALWAGLVVFLLVLVDLRSLKHAALALLPLVVGGLWMVGCMNLFGIGYSFANAVSIPLIIGVGIDSGLHVVHRWRECDGDVDEALRSTGRAILVSSLTTSAAFGALMFSAHAGAASLGLTLLIGVTCCALTALVVLPAALVLVRRT